MTYSDSYATGIYWRSKSDKWMIRLVYEAKSMTKVPPTVVARVVIHGAEYPVSASIDGHGRVSFDDSAFVPQYVRDKAAYILRTKYDRLRGTETARRDRVQKQIRREPERKPEPPKVVAPPRDSKGRFLSWDDNPYRVKPAKPKGKAKQTETKKTTKAPKRNAKGQFVASGNKGARR